MQATRGSNGRLDLAIRGVLPRGHLCQYSLFVLFLTTLTHAEAVEIVRSSTGQVRAVLATSDAKAPSLLSARSADTLGTEAYPSPGYLIWDVAQYSNHFGVEPADLQPYSSYRDNKLGMAHYRYQQTYHGIPVYGADLSAHLETSGELSSIFGKTLPAIDVNPHPTLGPGEAANQALNFARLASSQGSCAFGSCGSCPSCARLRQEFPATTWESLTLAAEPKLMVYNQDFVANGSTTSRSQLVWQVQLTSDDPAVNVAPKLMIDAHTGELGYVETGVHAAERIVSDCTDDDGVVNCRVDYFSANLDYTFGRFEGSPPRGPNPQHNVFFGTVDVFGSLDVDNLYDMLGQIQPYYLNALGVDGGNRRGGTGNGVGIDRFDRSRAIANQNGGINGHLCNPGTAFFITGTTNTLNFCAFSASPDVFAHEYAHVLAYYKNVNLQDNSFHSLGLQGETGALNEAHSDLFGEFFELHKTGSNDWFGGTNALVNSHRSLSDPPSSPPNTFLDLPYPDRFYHPNYYCGGQDSGGIHYNNSVLNKAGYLTAVGGTFNGFKVEGIGIPKLEQILFRALTTYYSDSETFNGAYIALRQAARDLYGEHSTELASLTQALRSVEMDQPGLCSGLPLQHWGDFDKDGKYFLAERDGLLTAINTGSTLLDFDLNGDDLVTEADLLTWDQLANYFAGPDLNLDGSVDAADAGIMFGNWGQSGIGDLNFDNLVDAADAGELFAAWTGDGVAAVPEPTSCYLLQGGVVALVLWRKKRRKTAA